MKAPAWSVAWLSVIAAGCADPFATTSTLPTSTQSVLRLRPQTFAGSTPCLPASPGGWATYTAVLRDFGVAGAATTPTTLSESPRVSCDRDLAFAVQGGREFEVSIVAFTSEGQPGWTAECGTSPLARIVSVVGAGLPIASCRPLERIGGSSVRTRVRVVLAPVLAGLRCGSAPGEVFQLALSVQDQRAVAACGEQVEFEFSPVGGLLPLQLEAFEAEPASGADAGGAGEGPAADAGSGLDAGPAAEDAGVLPDAALQPGSDAAAPEPEPPAFVPRSRPTWASRCEATLYAGVTSAATCVPLAPL